MITFEYPLNEKYRSYLRFELLFNQIKESMSFAHRSDSTAFFKAFFELLELSERCDIRHDLSKDLEQLIEIMSEWLTREDANAEAVNAIISELEQLSNDLHLMKKHMNVFKNNRFLTSLKQRFSIPSGCCNFDLPQFHFWNSMDLEARQKDAEKWFNYFTCLEKSLTLFLKIKRSQGVSSNGLAENCFYQGQVDHCGFIMIRVAKEYAVYPIISGHKNRFSIRFINNLDANDDALTVPFQQIIC